MKTAQAEKDLARRRAPSQNRSAATVAFILDAAEDILEEKGLSGFNTNSIAERAGVSVGSIYQYFSNKEAILSALVYKMHETILSSILQTTKECENKDYESTLRHMVNHSVDIHLSRPNLARILEAEEERLPRTPALDAVEKKIGAALEMLMSRQLNFAVLEPGSLGLVVTDVLNIIRVMTVPTADPTDERLKDRIYWALQGYLEKWDAKPSAQPPETV